MNEDEFLQVKNQVKKSGMKQQDYLIKAITNKPITNTDGIKVLIPELKRVGNNLNQLSRKANEGIITQKGEVSQMQEELNEIWQLLRLLIQKLV
jgi:hypothetical protein